MTVDLTTLDAHEQPSDHLRAIWKGYAKTDNADLLKSNDIDDLLKPEKAAAFLKAGSISAEKISSAFAHLAKDDPSIPKVDEDIDILHHPLIPGKLGDLLQRQKKFLILIDIQDYLWFHL